MENYYNDFYQNSFSGNDIKLLIVLKKFWLSGIDNEKNKEMDVSRNSDAGRFLYCKWEYYLNKGNEYVPIKRIDTVVNGVMFEAENDLNVKDQNTKKVLKLILNGLIEVFDLNDAVKNFERSPKRTLEQVQNYNASFYDIPVLKDSGSVKGVYLTFNEFKNNKPSIINFKEKEMRIRVGKTENYLEDEKGERITNYWGYCTGDEVKVGKYGNDRLYRKGNTFEFFLTHQYLAGYRAIDGPSYQDKDVWIPYQLDMETGMIY